VLTVDSLEVAYGDLQVVWGVSFEVPANSIVAILGPNGAGKTTTLHALMGLLPTKGGDVRFKGASVTGKPTHYIVNDGMVMIPEERASFATLTVADNLRVGAYTPRARDRRENTLGEVFEIFPILAERRAQLAGTLSGGERQMLAIAKALMALPELLILDEPSLGLAPIVVENTFRVIGDIKERGVSVLMVEQHVEMTLEMVDYAYILELGRIVVSGTSSELIAQRRVREAYLGI
jgi:branched-chain amino acid transport system ATP-binding protein